MAKVIINNNPKCVELRTLYDGMYFILNGELYLLAEKYTDCYLCYNLSNNETIKKLDIFTKVLPVPSEKIEIKVDI